VSKGAHIAEKANVLPWALVFNLIAVGSILLVPTVLFVGPDGIAAMIGLISGLAGGLMGRALMPQLAALTLVVATALLLLSPGLVGVWLIGGALVVAAGIESCTTGGRAFVLALYGWLSILLIPSMPPTETALPLLALGLVWGLAAARLLGLTGFAAPPPAQKAFGVAMAVFLFAGLLVASFVMQWRDAPLGYWMILLFIFRAVAPQGETVRSALKYGLGAAAGCGVAVLLTPVHLGGMGTAMIAFALMIVGMRNLPHPAPWSATAFTAAILMFLSPNAQTVLFRLEAAAFVVALTTVLALLIEGLWRLVLRQGDGSKP
jgi:hypothetical protein